MNLRTIIKSLLSPLNRIAFGLVGLVVSLVFLAACFGFFPEPGSGEVKKRALLSELVTMGVSSMADRADSRSLRSYLDAVVARYPEVESAGLRRSDGQEILEVGDHFLNWSKNEPLASTADRISIPMHSGEDVWGEFEFRFTPITKSGVSFLSQRPEFSVAAFLAVTGLFAFLVYLRVVLRQLNPKKVVPNRVREALDTLTEGLIVMDRDERIVLANSAFKSSFGLSDGEVLGKRASDLPIHMRAEDANEQMPVWQTALQKGKSRRQQIMRFNNGESNSTFSVSSAPIFDDQGTNQGAITSFDDITQLEQKKNELQGMLTELNASTDEIKRQNRDLEYLATRDPLTGCLNRRSFFTAFDEHFSNSQRNGKPLSALMVDIDHFKSINDTHGHSTGDDVLKAVSETLQNAVRVDDIVCRYGGEEFSILLPNTSIHDAAAVAEEIRASLERLQPAGISVTASLGVSALCQLPADPQELLDHADKCLYVAKRSGRNQVARWDQVDQHVEVDESQISRTQEVETAEAKPARIPFHAVTALISALAYRDQATANHCRRVADLCVAVGEGLLPMRDCYTLEIAGLLHDIGKVGIPDSILLKPGQLSEEEWLQMKRHERIGQEIIKTSFGCDDLTAIVSNYRYDVSQDENSIPLGARILRIVDAYDSMVSDKPYRVGMRQAAAFNELRKFAGKQFDSELVERFIHTVNVRGNDLSVNGEMISKAAALDIGLQIEQLAEALDDQDNEGVLAIAGRLEETACRHNAASLAEKAAQVVSELQQDSDLHEIVRCTSELMDVCRSAQRSLISQ